MVFKLIEAVYNGARNGDCGVVAYRFMALRNIKSEATLLVMTCN